MELLNSLSVTPIYIAILGLVFAPMTLRVGLYRVKSRVSLGNGDDPELLRRIRGQANFIETVPMALFLLITMELIGAPSIWLHTLCSALVIGRVAHYLGLTEIAPMVFRVGGMIATLTTILISSIWILIHSL
ncbi:MAG: MAPEG family protein [Pseudohongiellaceae bacterium]